ncbi:MAG: SMC family ATPase [Chloroflexaceae bacterium]|jgi:exonuclease SbcC|nr:SMC family ATPase [Chloroflexaceae bacterium]
MIPHEIVIRNFMCYRDNVPPLLLDGLHVACLTGENGAGKSTLLDAITWALWGKARMSDDELIAQGESEMQVDLAFQLNGQRYRVTRKRQRGKTGPRGGVAAGKSWLDLQVQAESGWKPLSGGTLSDTERQIEDLLRMKYDTFINASFLLQGRADEFTRKTATERKQVLADILDLREYAMLEERAKGRAKKLDDELKALEGRIETLSSQAAQAELFASYVADGETKVAALVANVEEAEAAQQAAEADVQRLQAKAEQRKELLKRLEACRAEQQQQEAELVALRQQIADAQALVQRRDDIAAGVAALAAARAEQERLDGLRPRYDELREQWRSYQEQIKEAQSLLRGQLQEGQREVERFSQRAADAERLATEIAELDARIATLDPLLAEREVLDQQCLQLEQRERRLNALIVRQGELRAQIKLRQDSLVSVREEQKRSLERLTKQLAPLAQWRVQLETAHAAQRQLAANEAELATMRQQEQAQLDAASSGQAEAKQLKEQGEQLKKNQALLVPGSATCPVCRSELGHAGVDDVRLHYDEELQGLRARYATCKKQADEAEAALKTTRAAIANLEGQLSGQRHAAAQVSALEHQLSQAEGWQQERTAAEQTLASVSAQLESQNYETEARTELHQLDAEAAEAGDAKAVIRELTEVRERIRRIERQLTERGKLEGSRAERHSARDSALAEAARLPEAEAKAQALQAQLDTNEFAHQLRTAQLAVQDEATSLGYSQELYNQARSEVQNLAHWEGEERALHVAEARLESQQKQLAQASELGQRRAAEIEGLSRDEANLERDLQALPRVQARAAECARATGEARRSLRVAENDLAEKRTQLKHAEAAAGQLAQAQGQQRDLLAKRDTFKELAEAFGKKGVQAMLIESAIPEIEREANRLLGRMTDNQMHLTLKTQGATKKGDTTETLEIEIADNLGTRVYDAFSGGEAMRVNFALRIALSRLLARRAGASLETLVIDEGFGTLDVVGRERFVEAITSVQQDFRRILVITHIDELKDRFPVQIEITKTDQGSRWELR